MAEAVSRIDARLTRLETREAVTPPDRNQTIHLLRPVNQAATLIENRLTNTHKNWAFISKWQNRGWRGDQLSPDTGDIGRSSHVNEREITRTRLQQSHLHAAEESFSPRPAARKQDYKKLPRIPTYDGVSDLDAYYTRFSIYARKAEWSKEKQLEWLGLLLEGKTAKYYTKQVPQGSTKVLSL